MTADQIHIHPTATLAPRVLLPGDPGRAMRLAQALLTEPKMFNHNRGLWGYTGAAADGAPLTIQATGMGGPSAAIVVSELIALGARTLVRVGTCGALSSRFALGELVAVGAALCDDGTSRALGHHHHRAQALPSPVLSSALQAATAASVTTVSTDLFYDAEDRHPGWRQTGAEVVEMECATLFTLARLRGVQAAGALIVTDLLAGGHRRIEPDALITAELKLGRLAVAALSA